MTMSNKADLIVVGADGSSQSQKAVQVAGLEAMRDRSPVLVLTIATTEGVSGGLAQLRRMEEESMVVARAASQRALELVADRGLRVDVAVLGSPDAAELEGIVERTRLLVLGDRGRGGQAAFAMGSTSAALARRFRSPVLVPSRPGATKALGPVRSRQVHVGLSGRRDESDLLRLAAQHAARRGARLNVLRAVPSFGPAAQVGPALEEAWRAVRLVPECAVRCRVEVVQDDPVTALLRRCGPEDVLVVGTRSGGTLAGSTRGSVARGVLDELPCDVIVLPPWARVLHPAAVAG